MLDMILQKLLALKWAIHQAEAPDIHSPSITCKATRGYRYRQAKWETNPLLHTRALQDTILCNLLSNHLSLKTYPLRPSMNHAGSVVALIATITCARSPFLLTLPQLNAGRGRFNNPDACPGKRDR